MRHAVLSSGAAALAVSISGGTSLVYQVVWERMLRLSFGADDVTSVLVASTFVFGLGVGAAVFGRSWRRPFLVWGLLELLIAAFGFISFHLLGDLVSLVSWAIDPALADVERFRWASLLGVGFFLTIPCILIGGTLPMIFACFSSEKDVEEGRVGCLYGANTLGAMVGVIAAPTLLLSYFPVPRILTLVAAANCILGIALLCASSMGLEKEPLPKRLSTEAGRGRLGLAVASFASGAAVLVYEVFCFRFVGVLRPGSPYNFALVLAPLLGCLALGSILFGSVATRSRSASQTVAGSMFLLSSLGALVSIVGVAALLQSRGRVGAGFAFAADSGASLHSAYLLLLLVAPFCLFQGGVFPLLVRASAEFGSGIPARSGHLYLASASGSLLGGWAAHFLGFEKVGTRGVLSVLVLGLALAACVLLAKRRHLVRRIGPPAAAAAIVVAVLVRIPPATWNLLVFGWPALGGTSALLEGVEGRTGTASVQWRSPERESGALRVGGKPFGSFPETRSWLFASAWALARENRSRVLLLGLGTATVLRELVNDEAVDRIDVVDWSTELPTLLARPRIAAMTGHALESPKVRLSTTDARTAVRLAESHSYDLVFESLTHLGPVGSTHYRSREYYRQVRRILKEDGVMITVGVRREDLPVFAAVLESFVRLEWFPALYSIAGNRDPLVEESRLLAELARLAPRLNLDCPVELDRLLQGRRELGQGSLEEVEPVRDFELYFEFRMRPFR